MIDNDVERYTEALLWAWKTVAEDRARNAIGKTAHSAPESETQRKERAIRQWIGKVVTLSQMNTGRAVMLMGAKRGSADACVRDCDEYTVTVGSPISAGSGSGTWCRSIPLENITISRDNEKNRLELQERYD